ncbi:MAG: hypothetical protein LBH42_01690 [Treponema sp.]|jgi:L-arabinose isomerase|nr:hypothetical protein [Treponema sp.]
MSTRKPQAGLLPLYLELYDQSVPEMRKKIEGFYKETAERLQNAGLEVSTVPICRLACEFADALNLFEKNQADAVITLHLAYSPSLESEEALRKTNLPLIVLDTTPGYVFDQSTDPEAILYNHGIHGVQDMCNLLIRSKKVFTICAGHMDHSDVLERVVKASKAAVMVKALRNCRAGLVGKPFKGMGDFSIPFNDMQRDLGITVIPYDNKMGESYISSITNEEINNEYKRDSERFEIDKNLNREVYNRSARVCLGLRKWLNEEKLTALSINFLESSCNNKGLPIMPFTECSNAMSEGLGYAGEGDILTAAFVGALLSAFKETTFSEIFCPDWKNGTVFMSHMGEYNFNIADGKPFLTEKPFPFTDAENPTVAYKTMKAGQVTLVNFAPFGKGVYGITAALGEMLPIKGDNKLNLTVNGWFKPQMKLESFLEAYSRCGGTHHLALVYGDVTEEIKLFAAYLGCKMNLLC